MSDIILERTGSTEQSWKTYKRIRDQHYVANHGTGGGRALHYLIHYENLIAGIISGTSASFNARHDPFTGFNLVRQFDEFYAAEHEGTEPFDQELLVTVINNSVFRLTYNEHGLASRVLALWRERVQTDWMKYGDEIGGVAGAEPLPVFAFETFIQPRDHGDGRRRDGACYRFDGWTHTGTTPAGKLRYVRKNERFLEWLQSDECLISWELHNLFEDMYGNNFR